MKELNFSLAISLWLYFIRMSDAASDTASIISEPPETPKKSKGRAKSAPKGASVDAGRGKGPAPRSVVKTYTAEEFN